MSRLYCTLHSWASTFCADRVKHRNFQPSAFKAESLHNWKAYIDSLKDVPGALRPVQDLRRIVWMCLQSERVMLFQACGFGALGMQSEAEFGTKCRHVNFKN